MRRGRQEIEHGIARPDTERMEQVRGRGRAALELLVGDGDDRAFRIAVGDVADGDLLRGEVAAAGNPVIGVPRQQALLERHALQRFDVLDVPQWR